MEYMKLNLKQNGLDITLISDDNPRKLIYLNMPSFMNLKEEKGTGYLFISGNDYQKDFSPGILPPIFKGGRPFENGIDSYFHTFLNLIKDIESTYHLTPETRTLAGYSMAGLFSLYVTSKTDLFTDLVLGSPSFWFPGFIDYIKTHDFHFHKAYFSIGRKESKTKNPYLMKSLDAILEAQKILADKGKDIHFVMEEGGHFTDIEGRIRRGLTWMTGK